MERTCSVCGGQKKELFSSTYCPRCEDKTQAKVVPAEAGQPAFVGVYYGNPFRPDFTQYDDVGGTGFYLPVSDVLFLRDDSKKTFTTKWLRNFPPYSTAWANEPHWRNTVDRDYYELQGLLRDLDSSRRGDATGLMYKWVRREKGTP